MFKNMIKLFKNFIGVDISKTWFDAALVKADDPSIVLHEKFTQKPEGFKKMQAWLQKHNVLLDEQTLFCMEYTGIYNTGLVHYLVKAKAAVWVEMPLKIKKAGGFERGTDDKAAAVKIAWYALRYKDQVKLWQPIDRNIEAIKNLIAQRDRIVNTINLLIVPVNELKECGCEEDAKTLEKLQKAPVAALHKSKLAIEASIAKIIQQDEQLNIKV